MACGIDIRAVRKLLKVPALQGSQDGGAGEHGAEALMPRRGEASPARGSSRCRDLGGGGLLSEERRPPRCAVEKGSRHMPSKETASANVTSQLGQLRNPNGGGVTLYASRSVTWYGSRSVT